MKLYSRWAVPGKFVVSASVLFLAVFHAAALIGTSYQMQLGNPSNATADPNNHDHYLIQRTVETIDYSDNLGEPNWASWDLTTSDVGSSGRSSSFFMDTNLPATFYWVADNDYSGSGYDRGHMCPSADRTDNTADNDLVFFMSNMIPQSPDNNQGVWANFETDCRTLAAAGNELLITCGPSGFGSSRIAGGKVAVPAYTWKIVVVVPLGSGSALSRITASTRVIAIKIPNISGVRDTPWTNFITSVNQIQNDTGFTFFTALPADVAATLRSAVDGSAAPGIASFSPTNGGAGTIVTLLGANFTSVSTVTFNGIAAAFTVNSSSQITATAPSGVSSGPISVTTPGGVATSSGSFIVSSPGLVAITAQPSSQTVAAGAAALFSVRASGTAPLGYQWRKGSSPLSDGGNISGSLTADLTISGAAQANAGSYTVVITNSFNSVTSVVATLAVTDLPVITVQPQNTTNAAGATATFTVVATGTAPLYYQWRKNALALANGGGVSGATSASLTIASVAASDVGAYSVVVTNAAGSATSADAQLVLSTNAGAPAGGVIAQWNFNNTNSPLASPLPTIGSGSLTLLGSATSAWVSGSGSTDTNASNNFSWNTSGYPPQGTGNKTRGCQYNVSTRGCQNIVITWDQRLSATASKYYRLQYSTNGVDFIDRSVVVMNTNSFFESKTNNLTGVSGVDDNPNFAFRIVSEFESTAIGTANANYVTTSSSSYGTNGTSRFDMMTVSGAPIPVAATLQLLTCSKNQFQLSASGASGSRYALQVSTNLADWVPVVTNTSPFTYSDNNVNSSFARFYRAVFLP